MNIEPRFFYNMTNKQNEYLQLLKDPRWQKKKTEILTRDNFTCQCCGDKQSSLQVHHLRYIKGHKPWEYDNDDLITLCENCHHLEHEELNKRMMTEVKIGGIYEYYHSDWTDTMLCYDIDYLNKEVYLMGFDNGAGSDCLYFIKQPYIQFLKEGVSLKKNYQVEENYGFNALVQLIYTLFNKPDIISPDTYNYNDFEMNTIINRTQDLCRRRWDMIKNNNHEFAVLYDQYEKGKLFPWWKF